MLAALRVRIAEAEEVLADLVEKRDALDARRNLGPRAPSGLQRAFYRVGRKVGRLVRRMRREQDEQSAVEAARARLDALEERIARLRREIEEHPLSR